MKGRQIYFYLTPADTRELELKLRARMAFQVLEAKSEKSTPRLRSAMDQTYTSKNWLMLYLVHPSHLSEVLFEHVAGKAYALVDEQRSPVIEYLSCNFEGGQIRRGRFYFVASYFTSSDTEVQKDDWFLEWASQIYKIARKLLKRMPDGAYVGREAESLHQQGLEFKQF